jgi:hypothetical protein
MDESESEKIAWLYTPPSSQVGLPPVETRVQILPFSQLSWQNFEKMCLRLVRIEANIERCRLYGVSGSEQGGIDIYARFSSSDKYRVYQCKNEANFGPAKIRSAVKEFIEGDWVEKSDIFVLCTRESLRLTDRTRELETQTSLLKTKNVSLLAWDDEELSLRLKSQPEIVNDFFGKAWVKVFCGEEVAQLLESRLDVAELDELRKKLFGLYGRIFNTHDRGIPLPDTLPLVERYILPDIEDLQVIERSHKSDDGTATETIEEGQKMPEEGHSRGSSKTSRKYVQRISVQNWIIRNKKSLLFGDPGGGKSTFLRFLALDILSDNPTLENVAEKWGSFVPVWVPFALWTKIINDGPAEHKSVKGIISAFLKNWDADELIPLVENALKDKRLLLLLDGLDEHSNTDAARVALNHLESFLDDKDIAVIATTRPHGFEKLSMRLEGWQQAKIADFSLPQQKSLAKIWFETSSKKINSTLEEQTRTRDVERQSDGFFTELSRSNELKELARNPLLLCLLISFQIANIRLPRGRFSAYQALTDHLLSTHPQMRRVAAESVGTSSNSLSADNLKKALAYLANKIHIDHSEGIISEQNASDLLSSFLMDDRQGFGMTQHQAVEAAKEIISKAEDSLGILVKRSQDDVGFYHRTMQEYLVSFNISRLPIEEQAEIVKQHCTDPLWREVILGLLQITLRPDDVRKMIESIQSKTLNKIEHKNVEDLLSEVAFGSFNCPPNIAKELGKKAFESIEIGTWVPHRERILKHTLDGLRSPILGELVKSKIAEWFPDRVRWGMPYVFDAMATWQLDAPLTETLFKGLNAEEYSVKLAAGRALAKLASTDTAIGNRLVDIAHYSDEPYSVAAVIDTLLLGWKDHISLKDLINRAAESKFAQLKLVGIKGRIEFGSHTDSDLEKLLQFGDRDSRIHYGTKHLISDLILKGWPKNEYVKKICLKDMDYGSGRNRRTLEAEIRYFILLKGYPMDEEVAQFCIHQLEFEKYPFLTLDRHNAFRLLAINFPNHQGIIDALDKWLQKQDVGVMGMDMAGAAMVGKTQTFKDKLLKDVGKEPWPHWAASSLLEGWGADDKEVSDAFTNIINSGARKTSSVAQFLPRVIKDKNKCRKLLLETLKDPECARQDFVLDGLLELGVSKDDTDVVDISLSILESDAIHSLHLDGFKADLIKNYSFDPRIKILALKTLEERDEPYWAVAEAFGNDPEIREKVLKITTPLPASLRQIIATYLSDSEVDENFALSILSLYDHEKDDEVKVQASIGYYNRLKDSGVDTTDAIATLSEVIVCGGPDHDERRMAAFCGLAILGRLDVMDSAKEKWGSPGSKAHINSIRGVTANVPQIQFILKNWVELKAFFKDEFWSRLFQHSSTSYTWNHLARFADEYEQPKKELTEFIESRQKHVAEAEILYYLSRTQPGSTLLLDYCLYTIGLKERDPGIPPPRSHDEYITQRDTLAAAEILGEQFGDNTKIPKEIYTDQNKFQMDELILALSEGWPSSHELDLCFEELIKTRRGYWESTAIRFFAIRAKLIKMYRELLRLVRSWGSVPKYRMHESVIRPLVRRLQKDDRLVWTLIKHLSVLGTPSEKISISKLIYRAKGLTPDLKKWAELEIEKQFSGQGTDTGFDITTGEIDSVPFALYEILIRTT